MKFDYATELRVQMAVQDVNTRQVARAAGLLEPTLSRYLHGRRPVTPAMASRIRRAIDSAGPILRDVSHANDA